MNCDLSTCHPVSESVLTEGIEKGEFFSQFRSVKWVNLYGGDPLMMASCLPFVQLLAAEGKRIRLWTNPSASVENILLVKEFVSEWLFFFPLSDPEMYQVHVGQQALSECTEVMTQLIREGVSPILHTMVTPDNVTHLLEIVDYAYAHGLKLWLHYPRQFFSWRVQRDILYFRRYRWVRVLPVSFSYGQGACKVPVHKHGFGMQLWKSDVMASLRRTRSFFGV